MIEWEILEEDKLPEEPTTPTPPRTPLPWKPILAVVALLLVVTSGGVAWRLRVVEAQVREDIEQVVLREERAIRLGVTEQAVNFMDPNAPLEWKAWYQSTYTPSKLPLPTPTVESIERNGDIALVVTSYEIEGYVWRNARAYRLTAEAWRRTPIPRALWEQREAHRSNFFIVEMNGLEENILPPEPLAAMLETFRSAWAEAWLIEHATPLNITFSPDETLTSPEFTAQQITLRSPLLNPTPSFAPPTACSLGIIEALAQVYSGELAASGEEEYLRATMRQAVLETLLQEQNGLCQIVERAETTPPPSALGLPPDFARYMVESAGIEAPYRFIAAIVAGESVAQAAESATNHPLGVLRYGAEQYASNARATDITAAGTVAGGINYGEIVGALTESDNRLQIRERQGVTIEVDLADSAIAECFAVGSQVVFTWESNTRVRDMRVLSRDLSRMLAPPLPASTRLIYQSGSMGQSFAYARTAEEESVLLFQMQQSVQIVPNPETRAQAFLSQDGCGWVLNVYYGTHNNLERWAISVEPSRVLWVGTRPAVLVEGQDAWGRAYWQIYMPPGDGNEPYTTLPLVQEEGQLQLVAGNRGRFLGYSSARPGFLMLDDHALHWTQPLDSPAAIGGDVATLPYRFADNVEFSSLSFDGRWLAYTVYPPDGRSDINLLDTLENDQLYLNTIPADLAGGESRLSLEAAPRLAVAVGDLGLAGDSGMSIQLYAPTGGDRYMHTTYVSKGEIDQLRWCSTNPQFLTFRESTAEGSRIIAWDGVTSKPILPDDEAERVLWCP